jgi:hypothetical protein
MTAVTVNVPAHHVVAPRGAAFLARLAAATLRLSGRAIDTMVQPVSRKVTPRDVAEVLRAARRVERIQPNLAAELRAVAARDE